MAVTVSLFNNFIEDVGRNRINLASDTFKVALVNGYVFDATDDSLSDIAEVLSTGNGYTAPGENLTSISWAFNVDATIFDAGDVTWSASGGSIGPTTGAIIFSDTSTNPTADRLVCYLDFGVAESAGVGTDFKVVFNSNGIVSIG